MITIQLHDVSIHAFHGIYEGEEKTGNPYVINLDVTYDEKNSDFKNGAATIDYVDLYGIVKQYMEIREGLLEKVCEAIVAAVKSRFPFINEVNLSIHKLQAPIEFFQGTVGVTMNKKFND